MSSEQIIDAIILLTLFEEYARAFILEKEEVLREFLSISLSAGLTLLLFKPIWLQLNNSNLGAKIQEAIKSGMSDVTYEFFSAWFGKDASYWIMLVLLVVGMFLIFKIIFSVIFRKVKWSDDSLDVIAIFLKIVLPFLNFSILVHAFYLFAPRYFYLWYTTSNVFKTLVDSIVQFTAPFGAIINLKI